MLASSAPAKSPPLDMLSHSVPPEMCSVISHSWPTLSPSGFLEGVQTAPGISAQTTSVCSQRWLCCEGKYCFWPQQVLGLYIPSHLVLGLEDKTVYQRCASLAGQSWGWSTFKWVDVLPWWSPVLSVVKRIKCECVFGTWLFVWKIQIFWFLKLGCSPCSIQPGFMSLWMHLLSVLRVFKHYQQKSLGMRQMLKPVSRWTNSSELQKEKALWGPTLS